MRNNTCTTGIKNGFTLVEITVAVFLFAIIMTIIGTAFVYALDLQRRAFNIQQTEEHATYVLEIMLKELRVSKIDPEIGEGSYPALRVAHPDLGTIEYTLSGTNLTRNGIAINSSAVEFTRVAFHVSGAESEDGLQPRITIFASIRSKMTRQQSIIDIQTSISPRTLND